MERAAEPGSGTVIVLLAHLLLAAVPLCSSCLHPPSARILAALPLPSISSDTRFGWTVGIGVEWAFTDQWSLKGEYDFLDFGRHAQALSDPILGSQFLSVRQQIDEVKLGVNYRWGGPFVASY